MLYEVELNVVYSEVRHDHLPMTYVFTAGADGGPGPYGVNGPLASKRRAYASVIIPDSIRENREYRWISRPGYTSDGCADLCYVVTNKTVRREAQYYGELDVEGMISEAVESGFTLYYPERDGKMHSMPVEFRSLRWVGSDAL